MDRNYLERVLREFDQLAQVPRPSHHEEQIGAYLRRWAKQYDLTVETDPLGAVIMEKPPTPGKEAAPTVILQAHMDMVCVAEEGHTHDFLKDPIRVRNDGVMLFAEGTSLGADNGIGMAIALTMLADNAIAHGPLRAIFTTNEEDGMDATEMDAKYLAGDFLINLDWETCGSVCVSSAGGDYYHFGRRTEYEVLSHEWKAFRLEVKALRGGHSGLCIHQEHANGIVAMAEMLFTMHRAGIDFRILAFDGGTAKNVIPDICRAEIAFPPEQEAEIRKRFQEGCLDFEETFSACETDAIWDIKLVDRSNAAQALAKDVGVAFLHLLRALPDGVHTYIPHLPQCVESSSNLGLARIEGEEISVDVFARSSVDERAEEIRCLCRNTALEQHFSFDSGGHVPGWPMNPESRLSKMATEGYFALTAKKMIVEPVHAGLECGSFLEKNSALDMIAIGPNLYDVHTTNERCEIASIEVTAKLTAWIIAKVAEAM